MRRPPDEPGPPRAPRSPRQPRPPRSNRPTRGRPAIIAAGAAIVFLFVTGRGIARFYTDFLWFDEEMGIGRVWSGVLLSKAQLSIGFTLLFFVLLLANLLVADRLAPTFRPLGAEDEIVARYQEVVGPYAGKVRLVVAALFALIAGTGAGAEWRNWLLFRNSVPFGEKDPQFGLDVSFFVFRLPFLTYIVDWLFVALVLVVVLTTVAHYLNGGIRLQSPLQRVTPHVKAHLSVLFGLVALTRAAGYFLQRYELSFSTGGFVHGAGYTDVNARLPALRLLTLIMIAAFALFIANIWRRGWALPVAAIAGWVATSLVAGVLYPAFMQNVTVKPAENAKERPYIERNIKATRAALGLDGVIETPYPYSPSLESADLDANAESIRNIRLWDPARLIATYRPQELRSFYKFADVDIDRYQVDGEQRAVVLAVRGLNTEGIPGQSWVNRRLQYTHGYGAVLSSANGVDSDGQPNYLVSNIPPKGEPEVSEDGARVYFSEELPGYAIVNTKQEEIDYQIGPKPVTTTYDGEAGVQLLSRFRRFAFAVRFLDQNIGLSSQLTDRSRLIFNRDVASRVRAAAPFLSFDSDPYPVVVEGRIFYMIDGYTTSSRYPYAQRADTESLREGDLASGRFNYVRNSVKVTVDAFTGATTFYVWDESDPVVRAYQKAFPTLFTSRDRMPEELLAHVRYPEDLFRVQSHMYGRYHVTDPNVFFASNDDWNISQDPGTGRVSGTLSPDGADGRAVATTTPGGLVVGQPREQRMEPTYALVQLPGDEEPSFVILQPFVPESRDDRQANLSAFLTARSDGDDYGKLQAYVMPRDLQIDGPALVDNAIKSTPEISVQFTPLNQQGSVAILGQVQLIPIADSLLYVRPLYVTSDRSNVPEVKRIIVVHGNRAVMQPTLHQALVKLFGNAPATLEEGLAEEGSTPPTAGGDGATESPASDDTVDDLLAQAESAFGAADAALVAGDLATYQSKTKEARSLVAQATALLRAGSTSSTTTTTAPSA